MFTRKDEYFSVQLNLACTLKNGQLVWGLHLTTDCTPLSKLMSYTVEPVFNYVFSFSVIKGYCRVYHNINNKYNVHMAEIADLKQLMQRV